MRLIFIWFLYKRILINTQKFNFNLYSAYLLFRVNYYLYIYLNNLIINNFYKNKNKFILIFNKKVFYKFNWMKKKKYIFKIKINFNFLFKPKKLKNNKKKLINKIIKSKRLTGLFKRRFNMRKTVLKKRSLIFLFLEDKKKFKKKKFLKRRRRFLHSYKVRNIDFYKNTKSIFIDNRKILKFFLKKKKLNRQNKINKYILNILGKRSKDLINYFEYKLSNILIKSHFFNNINDSSFFIKKGYITVNGSICTDVNNIININDTIKLIYKYNYYLFYRKSLNKSLKMSKKINWAFYKFIKKNKRRFFFPKVYKWLSSNRHFGFDIPLNFEVDFINMTVIILYKNFDVNNIDRSNIKYINLYLTRLYNWNFIV